MIGLLLLVVFGFVLVAASLGWFPATTLLVAGLIVAHHYRQRGPRLYPAAMRAEVFERDGGRCRECGVAVHTASSCVRGGCDDCAEIDHRRSWHDGGATTMRNARLTCQKCNLQKGADPVSVFRRKRRERLKGAA